MVSKTEKNKQKLKKNTQIKEPKRRVTVSDSRLRPLVTNEKPCVSMATPVRWTCSSMYLKKKHFKSVIVENIINEKSEAKAGRRIKEMSAEFDEQVEFWSAYKYGVT